MKLTQRMMWACHHMRWVESKAHDADGKLCDDLCPYTEMHGRFIRRQTSEALVKHNLAEKVACRFDCTVTEMKLTPAGRDVARLYMSLCTIRNQKRANQEQSCPNLYTPKPILGTAGLNWRAERYVDRSVFTDARRVAWMKSCHEAQAYTRPPSGGRRLLAGRGNRCESTN